MGDDLAELSKAKSPCEGETCSGPIHLQGERVGTALQLPSSGRGPHRVLELASQKQRPKGSSEGSSHGISSKRR